MSILPKVVRSRQRSPRQAPRQLSMAFDTAELRRLTSSQRANALAHLANVLVLAASVVAREGSRR